MDRLYKVRISILDFFSRMFMTYSGCVNNRWSNSPFLDDWLDRLVYMVHGTASIDTRSSEV